MRVRGARECAREYVSGPREWCPRVREWCTRERLCGLVSKQPAVSSLARVREVEAIFSRLGMGPLEQTLFDWAWDLLWSTAAWSSTLGYFTIIIAGS